MRQDGLVAAMLVLCALRVLPKDAPARKTAGNVAGTLPGLIDPARLTTYCEKARKPE
jgi:hypothetical protein